MVWNRKLAFQDDENRRQSIQEDVLRDRRSRTPMVSQNVASDVHSEIEN
jgi:hypothetical protein